MVIRGTSAIAARAEEPEIPKLGSTFGAMLVGTFLGLVLYGISLHQLYRYCRLHAKDAILLKALVAVTMILETLHSIWTMHACYSYLVTNYFNPSFLSSLEWSICLLPVTTGLIMAVTQIFFARRLALVGRRYCIIVGIAAAFLIAEFVCAAVATYKGFATSISFPGHAAPRSESWPIFSSFGSALVADVLLTGSIIAVLRRSRNGPKGGNNTIVNLLFLYIINTGLATAISNLFSLIFVVTMPQNLIYACFTIITTRLHANTLLAALNSRQFNVVRGIEIFGLEKAPATRSIFARAKQMAVAEQWNVPHVEDNCPPAAIDIKVTTETEEDRAVKDFQLDSQGSVEGDGESYLAVAKLEPNRRTRE